MASITVITEPVYGLPSSGKQRPVTPRQVKTGTTSVTLGTLPQVGAILIAGYTSVLNQGAPAIGGGGATWTLIGNDGNSTTNQCAAGMWVGVVGSNPTSTISIPYSNSGVSYVMEFPVTAFPPIAGTVVSSSHANATVNALNLAAVTAPANGFFVWTWGARANAVNAYPPSALEVNSRGAPYLLVGLVFPWGGGSVTPSFNCTLSGSSAQAAIAAIIQ